MITRRDWLGRALGAAGALALAPSLSRAQGPAATPLIRRAIPSTGELLPVIGLGSSATFAQVARNEDHEALRAVLSKMFELGGTVFDTAPSYGASEEVAGNCSGQPKSTLLRVRAALTRRLPAGRSRPRLRVSVARKST